MNILKALNWAGFLIIGLTAFLFGVASFGMLGRDNFNKEIASLMGAALGATITVSGTVWVARYQSNQRATAFTQLIAESIGAIRDEAHLLVSLTSREEIGEPKSYAHQLMLQIDRLEEGFELFARNMDISDIPY
ncbi:hypothetical protein LJR231_001356 [Phyllobacterium sp. LjRoot231]|uniref:hypothetical protein n=1 Tax=Phyllobacterium sp. LjRoot231 TaxID=3342289 RepID=UPI003ECF6B10